MKYSTLLAFIIVFVCIRGKSMSEGNLCNCPNTECGKIQCVKNDAKNDIRTVENLCTKYDLFSACEKARVKENRTCSGCGCNPKLENCATAERDALADEEEKIDQAAKADAEMNKPTTSAGKTVDMGGVNIILAIVVGAAFF